MYFLVVELLTVECLLLDLPSLGKVRFPKEQIFCLFSDVNKVEPADPGEPNVA